MSASALPHIGRDGLRLFLVIALGQTLGSELAMSFLTWAGAGSQAAVFLAAFPLITMFLCAGNRWHLRNPFAVATGATIAALMIISVLRYTVDSTWFFGPCPPAWELPGYAALAVLAMLCAGWARFLAKLEGAPRTLRWIGLALMAFCLIGLATILDKRGTGQSAESSLLLAIGQLEQKVERQISQGESLEANTVQVLSVLLAQAGRETDSESMSRWRLDRGGRWQKNKTRQIGGPSEKTSGAEPIDLSRLKSLPWRETMAAIASRKQLIIVMEAHNAPSHRQWLEQALPILQAAGYQDYAAEGLSESGRSLKNRGYPLPTTGFYVAEPHFANLLRRAIDLDFTLHDYESSEQSMELREQGQAARLAGLFAANPNLKLIVHAGYGHLFKTHRAGELKMMAEHLWEMTGIEPYCIWQIFHSPEEGEARQLARLLPPGSEPVMISPVSGELTDMQFRFAPGAVDALVIHSPSVGGPAERVHGFPSARKRLAGVWEGLQWPVMIAAFKKGEPAGAIALDQIMLREGEKKFVLWVPHDDYEIRLFAMNGPMPLVPPDGSPLLRVFQEALQPSGK